MGPHQAVDRDFRAVPSERPALRFAGTLHEFSSAFPFPDLSQTKLRPAVVLADAGRGDRILCQITSNPYGDPTAVVLEQTAFASGSLRVASYARPAKLFTASSDLITAEAGVLTPEALTRVVNAVIAFLRSGS